MFEYKLVEFKWVILGTEEDFLQAFVSGEDECISETSTNLLEALVDLISAYYVFDVSYAESTSGMLCSLQDFVLQAKDSSTRSIRYWTFASELRNVTIET